MLSGFFGEGGAGGGFVEGGGPGGGMLSSGPLASAGPLPGSGPLPGAAIKEAIKRESVIMKTNLLKRLIMKLYDISEKNKWAKHKFFLRVFLESS